MSRKSCSGCKYYYENVWDYGPYNECELLGEEYFNPNGCDFVNEDGSVNREELEEVMKYK